jgi:type II pantothenate kinase
MSFLLKSAKNPSYTFRGGEGKQMIESEHVVNKPEDNSAQSITEDDSSINSFMQGPKSKMLVSIGSGVSMIKINPISGAFERVSGTMIGGGTLMGLSSLLTGVGNFDDIVQHCEQGDNSNVDMLVKDIYGDRMPFEELRGDWLASSFAKVANDHTTPGEEIMNVYKKEDIIKSLMFMISFNIGQMAYLTSVIHDIDDIYFVGNYIRDNNIGKEKITFAMDLMSQK